MVKTKTEGEEGTKLDFRENAGNEARAKVWGRKREGGEENGKEKKMKEERVSGWFIESLLLVDCGTRNVRGTAG